MSDEPEQSGRQDELVRQDQSGRRRRDFWQLTIPLIIVLALCTTLTVIEARRATEGVWRAWWYMFEWPLFGLFSIWIWYRYRSAGSVSKGFVQRWRDRVAEYSAEFDRAAEGEAGAKPSPDDPQLQAWNEYRDDLARREPPGGPTA